MLYKILCLISDFNSNQRLLLHLHKSTTHTTQTTLELLITTKTKVGLETVVDMEIVNKEAENEIQISSIGPLIKTQCMILIIGAGLVIFHPNAEIEIHPPFGEDNSHPKTIWIITQPPLLLGFRTQALAIMWHQT